MGAVLAMGALGAAAVTNATAHAAPIPPPAPGAARAMAAQKATELVASRPAYLMASAQDAFVQGAVASTGPVQYVPYTRRASRGSPQWTVPARTA